MIGAVIETVLGPFILSKFCHTSKPLRSLIVDVLAKRTAGDPHFCRHGLRLWMEIILSPPQQSFVDLKDVAIEFKKIHNGVVVLKPIHPSDRRGVEWLGLDDLTKHQLEFFDHLLAIHRRNRRLVLGGHLTIFQNLNQSFK